MSSDQQRGRFQFAPKVADGTLPDRIAMRTPYGLEIIETCVSCPHREERFFCNLSEASVKALATITSAAFYPKGATLFLEGQPARGVFIVCSGRVKLSTSSVDGRTLILRISEPGELLGLSATVTGTPYELTADVIEPSQLNFISRNDFLAFLNESTEAALRVAQQLGENYHAAIAEMRTIGLSHSAAEKLARFLLEWAANFPKENGKVRLKLTLTHQEIGQMIGMSRETVTRLLADFRKKKLVQVTGTTLVIQNRAALENILNGGGSSSPGEFQLDKG